MMQKNESEQNRRKMRRGDKEAILKGLKGGLCDNYYGICCAVKYNMKDNDIIAALKELQKDTYVSMGMFNAQFASAALDVLKIEPYTGWLNRFGKDGSYKNYNIKDCKVSPQC